jgi:hypothetical protein
LTIRVKSAVLTVGCPLPLFPGYRTYSMSAATISKPEGPGVICASIVIALHLGRGLIWSASAIERTVSPASERLRSLTMMAGFDTHGYQLALRHLARLIAALQRTAHLMGGNP